jgi:hypothetical protein
MNLLSEKSKATHPLAAQGEQGTCLSHLCFNLSIRRPSVLIVNLQTVMSEDTCRRHSAHGRGALDEFARTGAGISKVGFAISQARAYIFEDVITTG